MSLLFTITDCDVLFSGWEQAVLMFFKNYSKAGVDYSFASPYQHYIK
jgi:hypothetical protein